MSLGDGGDAVAVHDMYVCESCQYYLYASVIGLGVDLLGTSKTL